MKDNEKAPVKKQGNEPEKGDNDDFNNEITGGGYDSGESSVGDNGATKLRELHRSGADKKLSARSRRPML